MGTKSSNSQVQKIPKNVSEDSLGFQLKNFFILTETKKIKIDLEVNCKKFIGQRNGDDDDEGWRVSAKIFRASPNPTFAHRVHRRARRTAVGGGEVQRVGQGAFDAEEIFGICGQILRFCSF